MKSFQDFLSFELPLKPITSAIRDDVASCGSDDLHLNIFE